MTFPAALRLEIALPAEVRSGETVSIVLRARNTGSTRIVLYLQGRTIAFDITIARGDGEAVWRRLDGQVTPSILQVRELAPGERLELDAEWDQRGNDGNLVPPGAYRVDGTILTDGAEPLRTPVARLRIVPLES